MYTYIKERRFTSHPIVQLKNTRSIRRSPRLEFQKQTDVGFEGSISQTLNPKP